MMLNNINNFESEEEKDEECDCCDEECDCGDCEECGGEEEEKESDNYGTAVDDLYDDSARDDV